MDTTAIAKEGFTFGQRSKALVLAGAMIAMLGTGVVIGRAAADDPQPIVPRQQEVADATTGGSVAGHIGRTRLSRARLSADGCAVRRGC